MSAQGEAARSLIRARRQQDAVAILGKALAATPDDYELHCLLAQAYLGLQRPADALRAAEEGSRRAPEDEWPHRLRSLALRRLGRHRQAIAAANESVRFAPEEPYARHALAEAHLAAKHADDAYVQALEAVRLRPDDADMHDLLGRCQLAKRRYKEAEASFRQALQLDPNDAAAHNNLGVVLDGTGRRVEAVHEFNEAARIDPSFATARQNLFRSTRFLVGGGSALFLVYLIFRASVAFNLGRNSPGLLLAGLAIVVIGVYVWVRRFRPFSRKQLPATAVEYYKAESKRMERINRPFLLLRLATIPLAVGLLIVAAMLGSVVLLWLILPIALAWYWAMPRLWRRLVQRPE